MKVFDIHELDFDVSHFIMKNQIENAELDKIVKQLDKITDADV